MKLGGSDDPEDTDEMVTIKCNWLLCAGGPFTNKCYQSPPLPRATCYSAGHTCRVLSRDALKCEARGSWHRGDERCCRVVPVRRCLNPRRAGCRPQRLGQAAEGTELIGHCASCRETHGRRIHG